VHRNITLRNTWIWVAKICVLISTTQGPYQTPLIIIPLMGGGLSWWFLNVGPPLSWHLLVNLYPLDLYCLPLSPPPSRPLTTSDYHPHFPSTPILHSLSIPSPLSYHPLSFLITCSTPLHVISVMSLCPHRPTITPPYPPLSLHVIPHTITPQRQHLKRPHIPNSLPITPISSSMSYLSMSASRVPQQRSNKEEDDHGEAAMSPKNQV